MADNKSAHDVGGEVALPIDRTIHARQPWENEVEAIWRLLARKEGVRADELRRGIEDLGAGEYDRLGYFERWAASLAQISLERHIVGVDDIARKLEELTKRSVKSGGS